jgi:hypothetical protein
VTGEYVVLKTEGQVCGFYKGTLVPDDVPEDQVQHHLRKGLISAVDAKDEPARETGKQQTHRARAKSAE